MDWCLQHGQWSCPCCDGRPLPASQAPDELLFMKSLARLAQMGDAAGCERLLEKRGGGGARAEDEEAAAAAGALTPLHYASRNGHADCVRILLAHRSAFAGRVNDATRAGGATPLHRASYTGQLRVVTILYVPRPRRPRGSPGVFPFRAAGDARVTSRARGAARPRPVCRHF